MLGEAQNSISFSPRTIPGGRLNPPQPPYLLESYSVVQKFPVSISANYHFSTRPLYPTSSFSQIRRIAYVRILSRGTTTVDWRGKSHTRLRKVGSGLSRNTTRRCLAKIVFVGECSAGVTRAISAKQSTCANLTSYRCRHYSIKNYFILCLMVIKPAIV